MVASVEYRLAPENPHPAPARDCVAATRWLVAHAVELGADGTRFVLMGDSAGGAPAAAIELRDTDALAEHPEPGSDPGVTP